MVFKGDFDGMEYKRQEKEGFAWTKGAFQGKMMEWVKTKEKGGFEIVFYTIRLP